MSVLNKFRKMIDLDNPFRLFYHKIRAIMASIIYGFPSRNMHIIGVTGTNGKTTTCNIIAKGLQKSGKKVFMFTTVNIIIGDSEYVNNSKMTSPDPFYLHKLLKAAKNKGCDTAIIETASHGIKMNRIWGISYDIAILTNITQDHLDLHKTMEDYVETKLKLFKRLIGNKRKKGFKKVGIINIDSDYSELFTSETYDFMLTYGKTQMANLTAVDIENKFDGTSFNVRLPGGLLHINTSLIGIFNVYNLLAAIGVFVSMGIKESIIENVLSQINGIPGRMEEIKNDEGIKIFVDYAHTPDAIENILETAKDIKGIKRVITVFGATGDRDRTKRPIMGEVVSKLSDLVILTEDDNYTENIEQIVKDILPGIERKEGEDFWIILNREDAIRTALIGAKENDVVVVLGKGDEHTMITNKGPIKWNDKEVINEIIKGIDDHKLIK